MLALTAQWTLHSENQGRSVIRRSTRRFMREGEARRTLIFPLPFPPSLPPSVRIGRVIHWYCSPGSGVFPV